MGRLRRALLVAAAAVALLPLLPGVRAAQAATSSGHVVTAYGDGGTASVDVGVGRNVAADVAVGPAGRTFVLDLARIGYPRADLPQRVQQFRIAAFLPTGTIDPTFGDGGAVVLEAPWWSVAAHLTVDALGRVVVVADRTGDGALRSWRLLPGGQLDPRYGTAGIADAALPEAATRDRAHLVEVDAAPQGTVAALGTALVRLDDRGALDQAYGDEGVALQDPAEPPTRIDAASVRSDGSAVALRLAFHGSTVRSTLVGVDADGRPDPTFAPSRFPDVVSRYPLTALDADPSGRVAVLHARRVHRVLRDGSFDAAFEGTTGLEQCPTDLPPVERTISASDDAVVVSELLHPELTRFAAPGGDGPWARACGVPTFGRSFTDARVLVPDDGVPAPIVLAGTQRGVARGSRNLAVAAVGSDLTARGAFGRGGLAWTNVGSHSDDAVAEVAPDHLGRLVVVGGTGDGTDARALKVGGSAFVLRLLPDGTPDPAFGRQGRLVLHDVRPPDDLVVRSDGSLTLLAPVDGGHALLRVTAAGALDPTFGNGGRVGPLPLDGRDPEVVDLAEGAGWIAVGGHRIVGGGARRPHVLTYDAETGAPRPLAGTDVVELPAARGPAYVAIAGGRLLGFAATGEGATEQVILCRSLPVGLPCPDVGSGTGQVVRGGVPSEPTVSGVRLVTGGPGRITWRDLRGEVVQVSEQDEDVEPWLQQPFLGATSVAPDGSVTVVRSEWSSSVVTVHRYRADGMRDRTFGDDGMLTQDLGRTAMRVAPALSASFANGTVAVVGSDPDVTVRLLHSAEQQPFPSLRIEDAVADEGGTLTFRVRLEPPSAQLVVATVTIEGVTADQMDVHQLPTGTAPQGAQVQFPPGTTEQVVTLHLADDGVPEPAETFRASIIRAYPAKVDRRDAVGTVRNRFDNPGPAPHRTDAVVLTKAGRGYVRAAWTPPQSEGASAVAGYYAIATVDGRYVGGHVVPADTTAVSVTVPRSSAAHVITVHAFNEHGLGPARASTTTAPSDQGDAATTAGGPSAVTITPRRQALSATWGPPGDDGGAPVTAYSVAVIDQQLDVVGWRNVQADVRQATVGGLRDGVPYTVLVIPWTAAGPGGASEHPLSVPSATGPAATVPGGPRWVLAIPHGATGGVVRWGPAAEDGGAPITAYSVAAVQSGRVVAWRNVGPDLREVTFAGLPSGRRTELVVLAWNDRGAGPPRTAPVRWP